MSNCDCENKADRARLINELLVCINAYDIGICSMTQRFEFKPIARKERKEGEREIKRERNKAREKGREKERKKEREREKERKKRKKERQRQREKKRK